GGRGAGHRPEYAVPQTQIVWAVSSPHAERAVFVTRSVTATSSSNAQGFAMRLTLRLRIVLTLVPPLVLIAVLGTAGVWLLSRLGRGIEAILHDNYRSVLYMERLGESLERIDASFALDLAGDRKVARQQYDEHWKAYHRWL